jgi:hypothetical protein
LTERAALVKLETADPLSGPGAAGAGKQSQSIFRRT